MSTSSGAGEGAGAGAPLTDVAGSGTAAECAATGAAVTSATHAAGAWSHVDAAKPDAILGLKAAFLKDTHPQKVAVGIGAYRTEEGQRWVLPSVREAARRVLDDPTLNFEYLPITGHEGFCKVATAFLYGADSAPVVEDRLARAQVLSGTGGLRVAAHFLEAFRPDAQVLVPSPTWPNHVKIFSKAGRTVRFYRYLDASRTKLDMAGLVEDLKGAPDGSAVLLHACAHNPTGIDPSPEQWAELSAVILAKRHVVIFDTAYQGFATGDADVDAAAVRRFVEEGHAIIACQSFAKNFGLYGERAGCLSVVTGSPEQARAVESQLKLIIRPMYSSPPGFGARIVHRVMSDPELLLQWRRECHSMADRIAGARTALRSHLEAGSAESGADWCHITNQIGMFAFTGLTDAQCARMVEKHHVYLTSNGRISMAGVNKGNVEYLAKAVLECQAACPTEALGGPKGTAAASEVVGSRAGADSESLADSESKTSTGRPT